MEIKRYIIVQAILTKEKNIIPIWDERIIFKHTENYGNEITLKDDKNRSHYHLIEAIYDLKTKSISLGVELELYPEKNKFAQNQKVLVEREPRNLYDATIVDVVFEDYDIEIIKGKTIQKHYKDKFDVNVIHPETLYALKKWIPYYILDNGLKITWEYSIYNKV